MYEICNVKLIGFSNTQLRFFSKAAVVKCPAGPSQHTVYVYLYAGTITVSWATIRQELCSQPYLGRWWALLPLCGWTGKRAAWTFFCRPSTIDNQR